MPLTVILTMNINNDNKMKVKWYRINKKWVDNKYNNS